MPVQKYIIQHNSNNIVVYIYATLYYATVERHGTYNMPERYALCVAFENFNASVPEAVPFGHTCTFMKRMGERKYGMPE